MEKYVFKIIPLAEIADTFPFRVRYRLDRDPRLEASLKVRGILMPLLVSGGSPARMISGHRRFLAARALGLEKAPALELPAGLEDRDLYLAAILSNWQAGLTELDRAWTIRRASEEFNFSDSELVLEILPALGLEAGAHTLRQALITAGLETGLLDLAASGHLPFRGLEAFSVFSKLEQAFLSRVLGPSGMRLTTNQVLRFCEWLYDLSKKKGNLETCFKEPALSKVLCADLEGRAKAEKFSEALRVLRFPNRALAEKKFQDLRRRIEAGGELQIEAPAFFEAEGLSVKARLKNPEAFEKLLKALQSKQKLLNSFFDIML